MRIRLHGTEAECRTVTQHLADVFDVLATSRPYSDRLPSRLVRIYIDTAPITPIPPAHINNEGTTA